MELQPLIINDNDDGGHGHRVEEEHEPFIVNLVRSQPSSATKKKKTVQIVQEDNNSSEKKSPKRYSKRQLGRYTSLPSFGFKDKDDSETQDNGEEEDDTYAKTAAAAAILVGTDDDTMTMMKRPLSQTLEAKHQSSHHVLLLRQPYVSLEQLNPSPQCKSRKSSTFIAMINLVATVCGGGVLSLPLCFQRAGILPTTLLMLYGAITTDFTLYLLVACARRTGGRRYVYCMLSK